MEPEEEGELGKVTDKVLMTEHKMLSLKKVMTKNYMEWQRLELEKVQLSVQEQCHHLLPPIYCSLKNIERVLV